MVEEDNLVKFPHFDNPMWRYMQEYYATLRSDGYREADLYLEEKVPGPLQGRVKATVMRMTRQEE